MARFNNLFDVGQVLMDMIVDETAILDVHVGPPLANPAGANEAIRITLLWATPDMTHRSDPPLTNADGTRTPPPITLHAYYLVTTYGTTAEDAIQAHNLLGRVMQLFHSTPEIQLPLDPLQFPAATPVGTGRFRIVQMPIAVEMLEKVFTPLQVSQRPWVLFEAGPVQLAHLRPPAGPAPLVRPGGVNLMPLEVRTPPSIVRITPNRIAEAGRVRIDLDFLGVINRVVVGRSRLTGAAIVTPVPNGPVFVTIPNAGPNAVLAGTYDATITSGVLTSPPATITVQAPTIPSISSPASSQHSIAANLVLDGASLGGIIELFAWPDEGLTSPGDVRQLAVTAAANTVTVTSATLAAANLRSGLRYRITGHYGPNVYTPYVLLEFVP